MDAGKKERKTEEPGRKGLVYVVSYLPTAAERKLSRVSKVR